jgi:hypothetical protein
MGEKIKIIESRICKTLAIDPIVGNMSRAVFITP